MSNPHSIDPAGLRLSWRAPATPQDPPARGAPARHAGPPPRPAEAAGPPGRAARPGAGPSTAAWPRRVAIGELLNPVSPAVPPLAAAASESTVAAAGAPTLHGIASERAGTPVPHRFRRVGGAAPPFEGPVRRRTREQGRQLRDTLASRFPRADGETRIGWARRLLGTLPATEFAGTSLGDIAKLCDVRVAQLAFHLDGLHPGDPELARIAREHPLVGRSRMGYARDLHAASAAGLLRHGDRSLSQEEIASLAGLSAAALRRGLGLAPPRATLGTLAETHARLGAESRLDHLRRLIHLNAAGEAWIEGRPMQAHELSRLSGVTVEIARRELVAAAPSR